MPSIRPTAGYKSWEKYVYKISSHVCSTVKIMLY
jgi:hypothetical protein